MQARDGTYTDARSLDMFLTAVKKKVIIVESYTFWRTDKYAVSGEDYFSSKEADLQAGKKHWDHFKKMDQWFLKSSGINKVLKKHKVKYINITNEIWKGEIVNPRIIQKIIEKKYDLIYFKELYSYIPKILFKLSGSDFISFSKAKKEDEYGFTLSTKNIFGLIPDPSRYPKYHGEDDKLLSQSIADMNKIYRSLFNCFFIVDGIFTALNAKSMKEVSCIKDWGVILGGKNSLEVDMIAAKLLQTQPPTAGIDILRVCKNIFGDFDRKLLSQIPKEWEIKYE